MIKLSKEAQARQERLLELEQQEELLKSQLEYTRAKTRNLKHDLDHKKMNMAALKHKKNEM